MSQEHLGRISHLASGLRDALGKPTDQQIVGRLLDRGIKTVVSVPCSVTATIDSQWQDLASRSEMKLIKVTNEHSLVGVATGIYFGSGEIALTHMQNSGLPNNADGVVSFAAVYGTPLLELVTWRGNDEKDDSRPHQEIGKRTDELTRVIAGAGNVFGDRLGRGILRAIDKAIEHARQGGISLIRLSPDALRKTYPLSLPDLTEEDDEQYQYRSKLTWEEKGSLRKDVLARPRISRAEAVQEIVHLHRDAAIIWSNGYNSRGALAHADRVGNFYNAGYMGGSLAIGWGLAEANPNIEVVVVDGDQNALMGNMPAKLAAEYPENLHWYVLDNGIGASVGVSKSVPLPPEIYWRARVIRTVPDGLPGEFQAPRIDLIDQSFDSEEAKKLALEIGPLPTHTLRFKRWIAQQTRLNKEDRLTWQVREIIEDR